MSKPIFIHEDSEFAYWWKILGTDGIAGVMTPKPGISRLFISPNQPDVDEYGFYLNKGRDLGRKTVLSGMEYYNLMVHGRSITRAYTGLNNKINFKPVDLNAYHGSLKSYYEIDEITQCRPLWTYPTIKLEKYISKLLNTEKAFDADFIKFSQWLKDRLKFKRMDRYDLSRNNFYSASRRYGITFSGQSFTTY